MSSDHITPLLGPYRHSSFPHPLNFVFSFLLTHVISKFVLPIYSQVCGVTQSTESMKRRSGMVVHACCPTVRELDTDGWDHCTIFPLYNVHNDTFSVYFSGRCFWLSLVALLLHLLYDHPSGHFSVGHMTTLSV